MEKGMDKMRVKSIDALRVVAILGVILIHTTTRTLEASHYDLINYSWTLFLNQSARFAAPLFFMISGFVLELGFTNHKHIFSYLKSRFSKIFIPYLFWSFIYYTFVYTNNPESFTKALLTGSSSYQLYFIPTLAIFYLVFPLLYKRKRLLVNKFIILFLFMLQSLLLNHDYFVKQFAFVEPIRVALLSFFAFFIGIIGSHHKESITKFVAKIKYLLLTTLALLAFYIFYEGMNNYLTTLNYQFFYSQWRVSVLLYSMIFGILLFYLFGKPNFQHLFVEKISRLSFFIFFIHIIVLEVFWKYLGQYIFNLTPGNPVWKIVFDPLYFSVVLGISLFLGYLVHKISKISKITG